MAKIYYTDSKGGLFLSKQIKDCLKSYSKNQDFIIAIPSLNPDEKLIKLVQDLRNEVSECSPIILVNDGSDANTLAIFNQLAVDPNIHLLTHDENIGKGQALRTAFDYVRKEFPEMSAVVTVDGDGQHTPLDISNCLQEYYSTSYSVILGCRNFDKESVPFRSRFGNLFSRGTLRLFHGINISDTQTGLRVIPLRILGDLLKVEGNRYEYEMNMLLFFKDQDISIVETPISTVYLDNNESSHFNPLIDSIKIYKTFFKYSLSAIFSFLIDILLFAIFVFLLSNWIQNYYIIAATIFARFGSACFNFLANKYLVFKNKQSSRSVYRYTVLFVAEMMTSAFLVQTMVSVLSFDLEWVIKIPVDALIFCIGFYIQKNWVFKKRSSQRPNYLKNS